MLRDSILEKIMASKTIEDVWARILERLQEFGFYNVLYGYTRFITSNGYGDDNDHLVLTNLGDDYVRGYFHEGRYKHAPIVQWASQNEGYISWDYVRKNYDTLTPQAKEVVDFNQKFGMYSGYTIGFQTNTRRYKGGIGLSLKSFENDQDKADLIWDEHGETIRILCGVAHLKIISLPFETRRLTKRQREALEWVGDGKTTSEVATIMALTPATIEKHLKLARQALDVETTAQAVLKAALHNQIYIA